MASFTLTDSQLFPAGSTVQAWPSGAFVPSPPQPGQASPKGVAASSSGVVSAEGRVTLAGLTAATSYFAGTQVAGVWRWVAFFTPPEEATVTGGGLTQPEVEALIAASGSVRSIPGASIPGQSTAAGVEALAGLSALPEVDQGVHTSNTAFGWHALKNLNGLSGVFPLTSGTAKGGTVLNLTGVEAKAGGIYAGGTSNTPMVVFRKLSAGQVALKLNTAYYVVAGGPNAFSVSLTKGGAPIAVDGALAADTEVALLTSAEDNTAIGSQAGLQLTIGGGNTLVGENAGVNLTSGEESVAVGCEALAHQQTTSSTVAIGFRALGSNTSGAGNTAVGNRALEESTSASENTAVGSRALGAATTGGKNTVVGYEALRNLTTGTTNTAVGDQAGKAITTGSENTLVGYFAGIALTTGKENVLTGLAAGANLTTGSENIGIGGVALNSLKDGKHNVAIGTAAGFANEHGEGNLFLGYAAGAGETGSNKLYLETDKGALVKGDFSTGALELSRTGGKVGMYGVAPVAQAGAIGSPAETLAALKTAVDAIRTAIKGVGITA